MKEPTVLIAASWASMASYAHAPNNSRIEERETVLGGSQRNTYEIKLKSEV